MNLAIDKVVPPERLDSFCYTHLGNYITFPLENDKIEQNVLKEVSYGF